MIINAYAKINLTIDITGVMPNGFHSLRSIMAPISLCDELTLEKSNELTFKCSVKALENQENICVRAAKAFFNKANIKSGASIYLKKEIPFPAGLGGGSADAAAVLKGLNELYGFPLAVEDLFLLAAELGSDVPLCLLQRTALCEGRGELLTPISNLPVMNIVIAIGSARLSTPEAFKQYDLLNPPVKNDTDRFLSASKNGIESLAAACGNAFEVVTDVLCPETVTIRNEMFRLGALTSHLSGSGPSVYGIFATEAEASNAACELKKKGFSAYACKTLN